MRMLKGFCYEKDNDIFNIAVNRHIVDDGI